MVGFYLLPRKNSQTKQKVDSNIEKQKTADSVSSPEQSSSSRYGRLAGRRDIRTGLKTKVNVTSLEQDGKTLSRKEPTQRRSRISTRQKNKKCTTPEVLFESTPLYVPNDSVKKSEYLERQNNKADSIEDKHKKLSTEGKFCVKERETAKQDSMLHTRSEKDEENDDLNTDDNYGNDKVFRSISPVGEDIHNMRIQAGIMINTHTSNRRGHYNNTR